jgi:hypothetical protein
MRRWLFCSILVLGMASGSPFVEAREMSDHLGPSMAHPKMPRHMDRDRLGLHHHFRGIFPLGFADEFVDYPAPYTVALETPAVAPASPALSLPDADRPPCHEVTCAGLVIDRGVGCKRTGSSPNGGP